MIFRLKYNKKPAGIKYIRWVRRGNSSALLKHVGMDYSGRIYDIFCFTRVFSVKKNPRRGEAGGQQDGFPSAQ